MDGKGIGEFVAVYGTLMKGERNERWRDNVFTVSEGSVEGVLYDTGHGFPAFVPCEGKGRVAVELLEVNAAQLDRMDVLEGYPHLYDRMRVRVAVEGSEGVDAIIYVMNRLPNGACVIDPGENGVADWRKYRSGNEGV